MKHCIERSEHRQMHATVHWLPAHCGIFGKEAAGRLVTEGMRVTVTTRVTVIVCVSVTVRATVTVKVNDCVCEGNCDCDCRL